MPGEGREFHPTPTWATQVLMSHVAISGKVLECCAGDGDIVRQLVKKSDLTVLSNDLYPDTAAGLHYDAADRASLWSHSSVTNLDWTVTNPPFSLASLILPLAWQHSKVGVAMFLRLSYLEPCEDRVDFLAMHPPNITMVLPRIKFPGYDGTDSVTCAWMVWLHNNRHQKLIVVGR